MRVLSMFSTCVVAVALFAFPAVSEVFFEDPRPLHPSMLSDDLSDAGPQFATDRQGNWLAVWRQYRSLVTSFSNDNGETWSTPALVHPSTTEVWLSDFSLSIATDGEGQWLLAVTMKEIGIRVTRSEDNGLSWSTPVLLEQETIWKALYPHLATDGDGTWVVMWSSRFTSSSPVVIRMSRSLDHGVTWSTPVDMDPTAASLARSSTLPRVIYDGAGHWVAVWGAWFKPEPHPEYGGDPEIMVSRSTDNWATWTPPTALNTDAASDASSYDTSPDLATDGHGNWLAAWEERGVFKVSRSTDNGATWTDPESTPIPPSWLVDNPFPDLATDGQGEWIITWHPVSTIDFSDEPGAFDRLIMQMFSQDNGLTWSEPVPMYDVDAGLPRNPISVIYDGSSSFLAVWWAGEDWGVEGDIFIARGSTLSPGGGGGNCFIATAAYGTPLADDINVLRAVRDSYMLNNAAGAAFVDTYYRLSPPVADAVATNAPLKAVVRTLLTPVVIVCSFVLAMPGASLLLLFACIALAVSRIRRRMTRAQHQS